MLGICLFTSDVEQVFFIKLLGPLFISLGFVDQSILNSYLLCYIHKFVMMAFFLILYDHFTLRSKSTF